MKPVIYSETPIFQKILRKMGITEIKNDFKINYTPVNLNGAWQPIPITKENIPIDEIEFSGDGAITYEGQYVLLYIRDHQFSNFGYDESRIKYISNYKFHIAECKKIEDMRQKKRFQKYVVSNEITGEFPIHFIDNNGHELREMHRLSVCRYCLQKLKWHGYINYTKTPEPFDKFDLKEYFKEQNNNNRNNFFELPQRDSASGLVNTYTEDWPEISQRYRKSKNYRCELCGADKTARPQKLHVHHRNGIKYDNRISNLQALCEDCHRKIHPHMKKSSRGRKNSFLFDD